MEQGVVRALHPELLPHGRAPHRRLRLLAGVVVLAGVLAGCSTGPNLAQDQANVNRLTALVAADEQAIPQDPWTDCHITDPATGEQTCNRTLTQDQLHALQAKAELKVTAAKFKLQVAQDQLKRDES